MAHPIRLGAVAAAAALLTLSACSQGSATREDNGEDGEVVVRYQEFSSNGGNEQNLEAIVAAFEEENPDIDVQVETTPYADYFTKLQTAVAGDTEADAFELNYENFVTYADSGALAELDVDGDAYTRSLLEAFQHDGAQLGLPESFSDVVLFYNKDLFAAAGVLEPTADWTWEDERAAAEALTDTAAGVWGDYQPATFHEFYKALAQAGGQFLTEDGSATAFNSPEGIAAATWLAGKSGTVMPTEADGAGTPDFDSTLFRDGKLAMWHSGIWMFGPLADVPFEWDVVVEPGDTTPASAMFTNGVVVSANSEHPEETQAWLEFLTSSDTTVDTRLSAGWELPPIADQDKLAPYLEQSPPANRQAVFDALDATVLPPVIVRQQEMQDAVTEELGNAAAGRKTVEQAVADAAARVDELL
ncbi:ABC transporter substrate-binding protein [Jiangella alkaliphila]|uniref:Carbohydrate ABC transporter substrate-binding protein, CUT1 family n=1 Tax=Jiangella alkaliphila TaxID=419479 RepID=A0A1H2GNW0_9ACTN|nr:sugar ABC transporter substrate-binding protein [Jiangella alkaliphila]SDU21244.1 carbohydrate ABC transporter substrate-binding protein, CUT1 family [Jiangella alkaliphila]